MEKDQLSFVSSLTVNPFYHPLHTDFKSQSGLPVNNSFFFFFFKYASKFTYRKSVQSFNIK